MTLVKAFNAFAQFLSQCKLQISLLIRLKVNASLHYSGLQNEMTNR